MPTAVIKFYGRSDEYGCFSNFTHAPFRLNGQTWPTVEHYFQAQIHYFPRKSLKR
jgi:predicted NAD-dependent protein-ADP-ribosyltransferase YbiA (DUF1768 family)